MCDRIKGERERERKKVSKSGSARGRERDRERERERFYRALKFVSLMPFIENTIGKHN